MSESESLLHGEEETVVVDDYESLSSYGSMSELDGKILRDLYLPDVLELPKVIRETVSLTDDPTVPVITFRYFLLSVLFVVPGAFIDTMNSYRTTSAAYSIFFVQIAGHWAGLWLAKVLPKKRIRIWKWQFSLNPGPWSIKETAMVTITANSGATGNLATNALSLADLHFGETVHPIVALGFMWAIVFVGYSYAAIAKSSLLYDPQFTWPTALMQTTLLQTQDQSAHDSKKGAKHMKVFFFVLAGITIWQLFPELIFPMTSSLAVLCWIAPYNSTLNFLGSGMGGMGVMNFSLDWANITSQIMLYPYWIQVIQFVAFIIGAWILIPLVKWGHIASSNGLMSNMLFTSDGKIYPSSKLLNPDYSLNLTAYEHYGPVHIGAQKAWNMFFDYAAYISGVTWVLLFGYENIAPTIRKLLAKRGTVEVQPQRTDRLNRLQRNYAEVPTSWYVILFFVSFLTLMAIFASGQMFMPWWACVVALVMGSIIVTPLTWLYALSNFQLAIGTFNELVYGYLNELSSRKHPVGALVFGSIAGDAWYRAQFHLDCMRLGFYMHLPPKAIFFSQLFGELIGVPINYLALRWVIKTKRHFLDGTLVDPLHQWTGQTISSYHTNAIQYVVLGPSRLFAHYPLLPYGFILGLIAPVILYKLHKRYPNVGLNYCNTTVFFSSMSRFYGNLSTGYISKFLGGTITMFYGFRYHNSLWKQYNYLMAAALDTGYNLSILIIFFVGGYFTMPAWWGNNSASVERCFAL
mgnify:CR=1 FL=1